MITKRMSAMLDYPLSIQEITDALWQLPLDRCSREDSLALIFFRTLWDTIGPHFLLAFQVALQLGSLGEPLCTSLISHVKGETRLFSRIGDSSLFLGQLTKF